MKSKKIISLISTLAILFAFSISASVSGEHQISPEYNRDLAKQIMSDFSPESYGGLYYDESGTLVVNVLPNSEKNESILESVEAQTPIKATARLYRSTDGKQRVEIKTVTYSYQSLLEAFNVLSDNMQELGIRSVAIEEKLNTVVVTPFDNDPTLQTKMDSLVDSNVVTIQYPAVSNAKAPELKTVLTKDVDVKPGTEAANSSGTFSIGFACGYNGVVGYTVPGHAVSNGQTITYNGETLGVVRYRAFGNGLDVAFVEKQDKPGGFMGWGKIVYKGSNVTPEGENIGSTVGKYVSGDKVHFRGKRSGRTTGYILNASYSESYGGVSMTDVVKANYVAIKGDSGGCVYYYDEYTGYPRNPSKVLGMQSASNLSGDNWVSGSYSIFSKYSKMTNIDLLSW